MANTLKFGNGQWATKKGSTLAYNSEKRPVSAVADNIEFRNVKKVIVKVQNKIKFNLLYDKNSSLQKKIKLEQLRKEVN